MKSVWAKFNYGDENPLDVPKEDFLQSRPEPLSEAFLLEREIDPPNWALVATCKLGGRRHPKRERQHAKHSPNSVVNWDQLDDSQHFSPAGPRRPLWLPTGSNDPAVNKDAEEAFNKSLERSRRRKQAHQEPSPKKLLPPGNLKNDDYRFWKGYASQDLGAQCRWCERFEKTREAMLEHHVKGHCKERLLALYRYAKQSHKQRYCFVCKHTTTNFEWGVPMCHTAMCIGRWKFNFRQYMQGMTQYMEWADDEQERNPTEGPYAHLPSEFESQGPSC